MLTINHNVVIKLIINAWVKHYTVTLSRYYSLQRARVRACAVDYFSTTPKNVFSSLVEEKRQPKQLLLA